MEFAANGDISGYAKKHNGITEQLACKWFYQSASGLSYLHEVLKTAHRDIKLGLFMLCSTTTVKKQSFLYPRQHPSGREFCSKGNYASN